MLKVEALTPLLAKVAVLNQRKRAEDIYAAVTQGCERADSSSMAQSLCEHVISMCHPRAWGDRDVAGFDSLTEWPQYLAELSHVAQTCWNQLSEHSGATPL